MNGELHALNGVEVQLPISDSLGSLPLGSFLNIVMIAVVECGVFDAEDVVFYSLACYVIVVDD